MCNRALLLPEHLIPSALKKCVYHDRNKLASILVILFDCPRFAMM